MHGRCRNGKTPHFCTGRQKKACPFGLVSLVNDMRGCDEQVAGEALVNAIVHYRDCLEAVCPRYRRHACLALYGNCSFGKLVEQFGSARGRCIRFEDVLDRHARVRKGERGAQCEVVRSPHDGVASRQAFGRAEQLQRLQG